MKLAFVGLSLLILLAGALPGQTTATLNFEVADVHVSPPGTAQIGGGFLPGGRFELHGATMLDLVSIAYSVEPEAVAGGPNWLNSDKFDVIAKAPASTAATTFETALGMLQALLAERFGLKTHRDQKEMAVYALLVGKKGAKLQPAKPGASDSGKGEGVPGMSHRVFHGSTMAELAAILPQIAKNYVDHPVVDLTELKGTYDFQLDWMGKAQYVAAKANAGEGPAPVSMFDAVEKLGLKLEAQKRAMPVVVVDAVNRTPTENRPGVTKQIPQFPTEFEVAEVRPSKPVTAGQSAPDGLMGNMDFRNGRVQIMGATLKGLIALAYGVDDDSIMGGPVWLPTDRFDVIAKTQANVPFDVRRGMLKTLIVERFQLSTHNENQPLPVFALVVGKRSAKLKVSDGTARSECKISAAEMGRTYTCQNTTMAQFAERLPDVAAAYFVHPMVDLTGLKGAYDFALTWTPKGKPSKVAGATDQASTPAGDITVFEAVDKQLGLKLEEQKYPMPAVVVDKANRTPREN